MSDCVLSIVLSRLLAAVEERITSLLLGLFPTPCLSDLSSVYTNCRVCWAMQGLDVELNPLRVPVCFVCSSDQVYFSLRSGLSRSVICADSLTGSVTLSEEPWQLQYDLLSCK